MTVLITGGAGFIGANFVLDWVAHTSEKIVNLDKLTYAGNLESLASLNNNPQHVFVQGDIGDCELLASLLQQHQPRAVLHFAAESHVDRSIHGPGEFIQTNIVGTFHLLEATRAYWGSLAEEDKKSFRFLHVSTDEVYGSLKPENPAFKETNTYEPNSPYSASKAAVHMLSRDLAGDLADRNINVNAVLPGFFPTSMTAHMRGDEVVDSALLDKIPLHRLGRADEIAGTIVFLSSRAGAYITGAEIPVDGGIVGCS